MRKILQINPVLRISTSTGRIIQEIGELAIKQGWQSYVAYSKGRDGIKECSSEIVPVGNKVSIAYHGLQTRLLDRHGLSSDSATKEFIHKIEEIAPNIIHIHNVHGYFLNYELLFKYLSESNIHVIWTVHDCWLYTGHCYYYSHVQRNKWKTECYECDQKRSFPSSWGLDRSTQNFRDKKKAFTSIAKDKMTIVPVSVWMREEMQSSFLQDYNYQVIHNGIDTTIFCINDSEAIREKYKLGVKKIVLGVASIWSIEKGWNDFIELSKQLQLGEVIVLVGVTQKQKESLPNNIVGINRTENINELAQLYSAASVFVNPTWQDNYPTVNLEAIACGTPVVTYRTGGSIEAITPNTGMIVEQGDITGLAEAISVIIGKDKSYYQSICREYALANFRKEDRYMDYISLYDRILSSNNSSINT